MTNEQYLNAYFSTFPSYFGNTWNEYREYFKQLVSHNTLSSKEIANVLSSSYINWKERAYWSDFFLYDDFKTEEDIKIDYMLLTWDILFPNEMLCLKQLEQLKNEVIEIIKKVTLITNSKSVHIDDIIWELGEGKEVSSSRFELLYMQREVGQSDIELEYIVPELWFFKLRCPV